MCVGPWNERDEPILPGMYVHVDKSKKVYFFFSEEEPDFDGPPLVAPSLPAEEEEEHGEVEGEGRQPSPPCIPHNTTPAPTTDAERVGHVSPLGNPPDNTPGAPTTDTDRVQATHRRPKQEAQIPAHSAHSHSGEPHQQRAPHVAGTHHHHHHPRAETAPATTAHGPPGPTT